MNYKIILICMRGEKGNGSQFKILENILIHKYRNTNMLNNHNKMRTVYHESEKIKDTVYLL